MMNKIHKWSDRLTPFWLHIVTPHSLDSITSNDRTEKKLSTIDELIKCISSASNKAIRCTIDCDILILRGDQFNAEILESKTQYTYSVDLLADNDINELPLTIGHHACRYQFAAHSTHDREAVLRGITPQGVTYDTSRYDDKSEAILHSGIMVSSSETRLQAEANEHRVPVQASWFSTRIGQAVVTMASHCFNIDGEVWRPKPTTRSLIGKVVHTLPNSDISLVRLHNGPT